MFVKARLQRTFYKTSNELSKKEEMVGKNLDFFLQTSIQDWTTTFLKLLLQLGWIDESFHITMGTVEVSMAWILNNIHFQVMGESYPRLSAMALAFWFSVFLPNSIEQIKNCFTVQLRMQWVRKLCTFACILSYNYKQGKMQDHVLKFFCESMETYFPLK